MMSRDHLTMHIDAATLQLMLRLLSIDNATNNSANNTTKTTTSTGSKSVDDDDDELCRTRLRLHSIVQQSTVSTGDCTAAVTLDNMTVRIQLYAH